MPVTYLVISSLTKGTHMLFEVRRPAPSSSESQQSKQPPLVSFLSCRPELPVSVESKTVIPKDSVTGSCEIRLCCPEKEKSTQYFRLPSNYHLIIQQLHQPSWRRPGAAVISGGRRSNADLISAGAATALFSTGLFLSFPKRVFEGKWEFYQLGRE